MNRRTFLLAAAGATTASIAGAAPKETPKTQEAWFASLGLNQANFKGAYSSPSIGTVVLKQEPKGELQALRMQALNNGFGTEKLKVVAGQVYESKEGKTPNLILATASDAAKEGKVDLRAFSSPEKFAERYPNFISLSGNNSRSQNGFNMGLLGKGKFSLQMGDIDGTDPSLYKSAAERNQAMIMSSSVVGPSTEATKLGLNGKPVAADLFGRK